MPQGIVRLRNAIAQKFPRLSRIYTNYHTTISALAIISFVAFVAYIGISQHTTEVAVTHVQGDVSIIKQQSSCSPKPDGRPKNPKQCKENFDTIIHKILTPLQACEFLERGAPLIQIGGKPIPQVECRRGGAAQVLQGSSTNENPSSNVPPAPITSTDGSVEKPPHHTATSEHTHHPSDNGSHQGHNGHGGHHNQPQSPTVPSPAPVMPTPSAPENNGKGNENGKGGGNGQGNNGNGNGNTRLLPEVLEPVEGILCHTVFGHAICKPST